jgi:hypothetical protein
MLFIALPIFELNAAAKMKVEFPGLVVVIFSAGGVLNIVLDC